MADATWMALGMTSLLDCPLLTWSLGWTRGSPSRLPVRISVALVAITSFAFMLVEVPEPVWYTSTTNWSSQRPSTTSSAAWRIASPAAVSNLPAAVFASAMPSLISPNAMTSSRGNRSPLIGKFSTARCVCAA